MSEENDELVFLDGFLDVPPDRLEAVSAALPTHIQLTHAEPGCVSLTIIPSEEVEGRLLIEEVFTDHAAFDAHQERIQNSEWSSVTEGIPREYVIRKRKKG